MRPFCDGNQVEDFAATIVKTAFGLSDAAKIEAHRGDAEFIQCTRAHGDHFIVQGTAVRRVGVADDGQPLPCDGGFGQIDRQLQLTGSESTPL